MCAQKIDILPKFHPKPPIFRTNLVRKTANGGTLVRSMPHKTPLKKGTSSLRSEVKKAQKVAERNETIKKAVIKRRDKGMLSPVMPKTESQSKAFTNNYGFELQAKKGKMIKARGGGMAIQGMKPTKLY